jgi:hypothetical protein
MVVHICNPSTWEAESGRSQVQGKLHSEILFQKSKQPKIIIIIIIKESLSFESDTLISKR